MKVISFRAKGVNGFLDFDFKFDKSLNFLIGINGSGKTTAIKLILGLLSPSWLNLTQIKYSLAEVKCSSDDKEFIIKSEYINNERINLSLIFSEDKKSSVKNDVRVQDIPTIQANNYNRIELRQIMSRYSRYESHFLELNVVKEIRKMNVPAFLGLDRRIHEGNEIDLMDIDSYISEREFKLDVKGNLYESLLDVENLIRNSYLKYSQKQASIGAELKNRIIYSSFDVIQGNKEFALNIKTDIDIESRKNRIIQASKNFEIQNLEPKILSYFNELQRIQAELKKKQNKKKDKEGDSRFIHILGQWFINSPQLERIDKIISLYETAQNEIINEYKQFTLFESLTNLYFSENNKRLFVEKNGEITVELPNKNHSNIFKLSSGEKQIIVMLAQLIFGKKRPVFFIDEPELSLHLGWQEIFVKTIIEASPETQFILATHSPSIVGPIENEKYCIDLSYSYI